MPFFLSSGGGIGDRGALRNPAEAIGDSLSDDSQAPKCRAKQRLLTGWQGSDDGRLNEGRFR
jgi:hypothetical protein